MKLKFIYLAITFVTLNFANAADNIVKEALDIPVGQNSGARTRIPLMSDQSPSALDKIISQGTLDTLTAAYYRRDLFIKLESTSEVISNVCGYLSSSLTPVTALLVYSGAGASAASILNASLGAGHGLFLSFARFSKSQIDKQQDIINSLVPSDKKQNLNIEVLDDEQPVSGGNKAKVENSSVR